MALREALGLTRRAFAEALYMGERMVYYWQTGKHAPTRRSCRDLTRLNRTLRPGDRV